MKIRMHEEQLKKLKALSDIASIDIDLELNEVLQRILKITCDAMNATSGNIMLVKKDTNELKIVYSYGISENQMEKGSEITAHISAPMKKGSKVVGILNAYMNEVHKFSEEEIYFLNIVASRASSIVQNARICTKLKDNFLKLNEYEHQLEEKIRLSHRKLLESEKKYKDLFENADDPMYTINTQGYFKTINKAGVRILESTEKEIVGSHISEWLTPESMKYSQEILEKQINGNTWEDPVIIEVISKNGIHKFGEAKTRIIKDGNEITGVHGVVRDITEKMKLEQKVRDYHEKLEKSYEELLHSDRIKTEFISNITHELLTPLTSIRGFVELLDDETMGKVNAEQKKSLEIILRNSDRLIRLIKELIDTSYMENDRLGLKFGLVSINNLLSKCIQDIHPQANDKKIIILSDIQQLPDIWGDDERLVQVIMNLLINAIKFTPEKGKIAIGSLEESDYIKISISDTGIGIPADRLKTVFDRFYQVDGSSSRKFGGIGLGLSISKSIINKHFGKIWAESGRQGSTFHILLPKLGINPGERDV